MLVSNIFLNLLNVWKFYHITGVECLKCAEVVCSKYKLQPWYFWEHIIIIIFSKSYCKIFTSHADCKFGLRWCKLSTHVIHFCSNECLLSARSDEMWTTWALAKLALLIIKYKDSLLKLLLKTFKIWSTLIHLKLSGEYAYFLCSCLTCYVLCLGDVFKTLFVVALPSLQSLKLLCVLDRAPVVCNAVVFLFLTGENALALR